MLFHTADTYHRRAIRRDMGASDAADWLSRNVGPSAGSMRRSR